MIDSQFVEKLTELEAKGPDGVSEMRQVLKEHGGMRRLLAIAMLGLGVKPKKQAPGLLVPNCKSRVADDFPSEHEKQRAVAYWSSKRRPDLVAKVEDIAEQFNAHFTANGTRAESWPARWRNWYMSALEFNRPPRDSDLSVVSLNPIQQQRISVAEWVARLETFYGDSEMPAGTWNLTWGGKPPANASDPIPSNCACPTQAFALYLERKKRRA